MRQTRLIRGAVGGRGYSRETCASVSLALGQTLEHDDEDEDMMRDYEVVD